jgi:K+ transporter
MLKKPEAAFWRSIAWALGILLAICVGANSVREEAIPYQVTLLLFGGLIALGVGNAIVNPRSSPVRLAKVEEKRFRRNQYAVGIIFSIILALLMVLTELGNSTLAWLFAPIMTLPYVLVIRERIMREYP